MKILIASALMAGLVSGAAFAQSSPDSSTPSVPAQAPQTQTAPTQQPAQPQSGTPSGTTQGAASQAPSTNSPRIAPGSVIPVQLTKTIDAKKAKPGDEVLAKVTMDLKTNSGEVVVPKDTKVVGHVTEAQARSKEQKESQIAIAFDRAVLKSGDMALPMSIQAVIAPPSSQSAPAGGGGGYEQPAPSGGGSAASSPMGGGGGRTGAGQPQASAPQNAPSTGAETPQQQGSARPQITGNTTGVVGISDLTLTAGGNATQGSVLTSEKNNVKVESGTMLLLKVSQ